jgi:phosphoribosylamine--glycine ligase
VNLVVVGPEAPLAAGVVDALEREGVAAIGPPSAAAKLEASKAFGKAFMNRYGVPTAQSRTFSDFAQAERYISRSKGRIVLKKSGLAEGKGVFEASQPERRLSFARSVLQNDELVVEEFLEGQEVSVFALADGRSYTVLPACADYKKAGEGNRGPNTGGMGAICPVPWLTPKQTEQIEAQIVAPSFAGLAEEGLLYRGVLYFGVMITDSGPKLLEYNVRFGDPETQVLLPVLAEDFGALLGAMKNRRLNERNIQVSSRSALGVVIASPGYPGTYPKDIEVTDLPSDRSGARVLFHAATYRDADGTLRTAGGRCFTSVGIGAEMLEARGRAYQAAADVHFDGAWFRSDIGGSIFGS